MTKKKKKGSGRKRGGLRGRIMRPVSVPVPCMVGAMLLVVILVGALIVVPGVLNIINIFGGGGFVPTGASLFVSGRFYGDYNTTSPNTIGNPFEAIVTGTSQSSREFTTTNVTYNSILWHDGNNGNSTDPAPYVWTAVLCKRINGSVYTYEDIINATTSELELYQFYNWILDAWVTVDIAAWSDLEADAFLGTIIQTGTWESGDDEVAFFEAVNITGISRHYIVAVVSAWADFSYHHVISCRAP